EKLKYQRSFQIMGVPLAGRPKSRALTVAFGYENEGLTYPTETAIMKNVYIKTAELGLEEKIVLHYRTYRFFKVETEAAAARPSAAPDPNATPPPPSPPSDPNHP